MYQSHIKHIGLKYTMAIFIFFHEINTQWVILFQL